MLFSKPCPNLPKAHCPRPQPQHHPHKNSCHTWPVESSSTSKSEPLGTPGLTSREQKALVYLVSERDWPGTCTYNVCKYIYIYIYIYYIYIHNYTNTDMSFIQLNYMTSELSHFIAWDLARGSLRPRSRRALVVHHWRRSPKRIASDRKFMKDEVDTRTNVGKTW